MPGALEEKSDVLQLQRLRGMHRCAMTTFRPDGSTRARFEPLRILRTFRAPGCGKLPADPRYEGSPFFGINLSVADSHLGSRGDADVRISVRVGDTVRILERAPLI